MEDPVHINSNLNFLEGPEHLGPPDASVYLWLDRSFPSDSTHLPPNLETISSTSTAVKPNTTQSRQATLQRLHHVQSLESENSNASSIDQLLRERETDPEELLANLGFVKNNAVTVPRRFLRNASTLGRSATIEDCSSDEETTDLLTESVLQAVYRLSHAVSILSQAAEGSLSFQVTGDRFRLPKLQGQQWGYSELSNGGTGAGSNDSISLGQGQCQAQTSIRFRSVLHPDNQKFLKEQGLYDELVISAPARLNGEKQLTITDPAEAESVIRQSVQTTSSTVLLHLSGSVPGAPLSRSRSDSALRVQRMPLDGNQSLAHSKDSTLDKMEEKKVETIRVVQRAMQTIEEIRHWQRENEQVACDSFGDSADQVTELRTLLNEELNETEVLLAHQLRHILQLDDIPIANEWWTQLERIAQEARCLHEALLAFATPSR